MNKSIIQSIIRHSVGMLGVWIATKYGFNLDEGTVNSVSELVIGLVLSGGAVIAGSVDKTKPKDVLIDNPIIEPESTKLAPKGFFLSERSMNNLKGVNKDLVKVIQTAIVNSPYDFVVTEGIRSAAKQAEMLRTKKSQVRHSKHQDGLAVDIMAYDENGKGTWEHTYYEAINRHIQEIANLEGVTITWGGAWTTLVDSVHFQIEP